MKRVLIFSCLLVSALPVSCGENSELLLVQILFRHGDRAPIELYPNDPNPESVWKEGLGKLTLLGRKQSYALGKFLRRRYENFVTSSPNEIQAWSSEVERCLQSAASLLASFFAPTPQWQFEEDLEWQPIPVWYTPQHQDKFLRMTSYCPRASKEQDRLLLAPEIRAYIKEHEEMYDSLSKESGLDVAEGINASELFDVLSVEKKHHRSVPSWADRYWEELEDVTGRLFFWTFHSPVLHRLRAGPILGKIIELMKSKIAGDIPSQKVQLYSAHDVNLAALLVALDLFNMRRPPYCATLLFELHKMADSRMAVRLLFLNSTTPETGTQTPHVLTLEGCSEFCPLDHFVNSVESLIPDDWEKECQLSDSDEESVPQQKKRKRIALKEQSTRTSVRKEMLDFKSDIEEKNFKRKERILKLEEEKINIFKLVKKKKIYKKCVN